MTPSRTEPRIVVVDPHDDAALAEWHAVETASVHHGRPFALQRSLAALAASVQHPSPWSRRVLLAAVVDGEPDGSTDDPVVGVAELVLKTGDNAHLAELEIHVDPAWRRRGVGRALHDAAEELREADGRTTVLGELYVPVGGSTASLDFAGALGFSSAHEEEHLAMRLPADPLKVDVLTRSVPGYEVLTWQGACPGPLRAAYVAMRNQMNADVPTAPVEVVHEMQRVD